MAESAKTSRINTAGFRAVKEFLEYSDHLDAVAEAATSEVPCTGIMAFAERVAKKSNVGVRPTRNILHFLANMRILAEAYDQPPLELLDEFNQAINNRETKVLGEDDIKKWNAILPNLKGRMEAISDDSPLLISSKAEKLAYERANVVNSTRIITDIRPVFDSGGTRILEMVITHSLMVYCNDDSEYEFALDASDVSRLREQCDRARVKAGTLLNAMEGMRWRTTEFPETGT